MTIVLSILKNVVDVIIIIAPLMPLVIALTKYIGKKSKNQNIYILATRAEIIVRALNQVSDGLELTNEHKKTMAVEKISEYANEVGIKLSVDQASDYIESAVKLLNERSEQLG